MFHGKLPYSNQSARESIRLSYGSIQTKPDTSKVLATVHSGTQASAHFKYPHGHRRLQLIAACGAILGACLESGALNAQTIGDHDNAFRLPLAGKALSTPALSQSQPSLAWIASEDGNLYVVSEKAVLVARAPLGGRPTSPVILDPFDRAFVFLDNSTLAVWTQQPLCLWKFKMNPAASTGKNAISFGSDGRCFVAWDSSLACINAAGRVLWQAALPGELGKNGLATDGLGRPVVALVDGSLITFSPYGTLLISVHLDASPVLIRPVCLPVTEAGLPGAVTLIAATSDGTLHFLNVQGNVIAQATLDSVAVDAAGVGPLLYVLSEAGTLYAITSMGVTVWRTDTAIKSGTLSCHENYVVVADARIVNVVNYRGNIAESFATDGAYIPGKASAGGLFYSPGKDWVLSAIRMISVPGKKHKDALQDYPSLPPIPDDSLLASKLLSSDTYIFAYFNTIDSKLQNGTIKEEEPEYSAACLSVGRGEYLPRGPDGEAVLTLRLAAQSRAIELLGTIGSTSFQPFLIGVLYSSKEVHMRIAAIRALAAISVDPEGRVAQGFYSCRSTRDEGLAYTLIDAISAMAHGSGKPPDANLMRMLFDFTNAGYSTALRDKARDTLARLATIPTP